MENPDFFDTPEQQSIVKTKIVSKYFGAWSRIMLNQHTSEIAYVDLFSGPGVFSDGTPSTPIWILNHAVKSKDLCSRLVTVFNDRDANYADQLQMAIQGIQGVENLVFQPRVTKHVVGNVLLDLFRGLDPMPSLFFLDPWGYKGLSLDLIGASIKNWGCECIFFFNYNRINPGIGNPLVVERMNEIFGEERAHDLRERVRDLNSEDRRKTIMMEFAEAVREVGGRFVLPFGVRSQHGERTSHYIVFVSKHIRGYSIMKDVMAGMSSDGNEVKSFEFVPVRSPQLPLPDFNDQHSISHLKNLLVQQCAGKSMTVKKVYEDYTVDTPYLLRNVKTALTELEAEGRVTISPPRRKGTLAKDKIVTFPATKGRPDGAEFDD